MRECKEVLTVKFSTDAVEAGTDFYRLRTEDGVEVRKLYFKLLDKSMGSEEVKFLLSVYGSIEEIIIFGKNVQSGWRMRNRGFVTFEKGSEASLALINRKKFSEFFTLAPADTWNQPDCGKLDKTASDDEFEEKSKLLEMLNDDCLLHVMKFLDILEIITVGKVCQKFSELSEIYFKTVKVLNFNDVKSKKKLTVHEAKLIFEAVGENVVKASINSEKFYNRRVLNFIPTYLTNVKSLQLNGFKLESTVFWDNLKHVLSKSESLDLSDNSEVDENFLKSFRKMSNTVLSSLNVSNTNVNGIFLKDLPNVASLNVSGCRYVHGKQLIDFVNKNNNLRSLDISRCPNIYGKDVNDLLMKSLQLEVLSLDNYYIDDETSRFVIPSINPLVNLKELTIQNVNYPPCDQLLRTINLENQIEVLNISYGNLTLTSVYAISAMKHLKKLIMNFKNSVPEDLVDYLMELKRLEELHISSCSYISPANALRLLQLPRMKFLDISRCYGFSNEFVTEAVERLKEIASKKIFLIIVGQTEIDRKVFAQPGMRQYRDVLQLSWCVTRDVEHDYDIDEENKYGVNKPENQNQQELFTIDGES